MTHPPHLFAYLLQNCPYSQKMAKLLTKDQKQWVRRDSPRYHELKKTYATFPIVFMGKKYMGGYEDFISRSSSRFYK
jgi:glutaredoxin